MKQRPARHRRAGRKVFVNRKQSALFYSVNRKKLAQMQGFTRFR